MKRTIRVMSTGIWYKNKSLGWLPRDIYRRFGMRTQGKYLIEIKEGSAYSFEQYNHFRYYRIRAVVGHSTMGTWYNLICKEAFDEVFFVPKEHQLYDIRVTKKKGA